MKFGLCPLEVDQMVTITIFPKPWQWSSYDDCLFFLQTFAKMWFGAIKRCIGVMKSRAAARQTYREIAINVLCGIKPNSFINYNAIKNNNSAVVDYQHDCKSPKSILKQNSKHSL